MFFVLFLFIQAQHLKKKTRKGQAVDANNNSIKEKNANNSFSEGIGSINDAINPQDMSNQSGIEEIDKFSNSSRNSNCKMSVIECETYEY